ATVETATRNSVDRTMDWYSDPDNPDSARQTLYMNTFLRDTGEGEQFDVECRPGVLYSGTGSASMIHFVSAFTFRAGTAHKIYSKQSLLALVDLGTLEVKDGRITKSAIKVPRLSGVSC